MYNLYDFIITTEINKDNMFSFIFPIVMVKILPIKSYFQEKNFRNFIFTKFEF